MPRPTLTVVIPIFNEEEVIPELARRLREVIQVWNSQIDSWEVVFVNDGSKDKSLEQLRMLATSDPRFKVISFSRNFGHQMAITAGLDRAQGEAVVIMDADLQDPPEVVSEMITRCVKVSTWCTACVRSVSERHCSSASRLRPSTACCAPCWEGFRFLPTPAISG